MKRISTFLAVAALSAALFPATASAWGTHGHHVINHVAAQALPATMPAFTRTSDAVTEITMLGSFMDDLKGSGESWNDDNNPAHFLDLSDDGMIGGVVSIHALPDSRVTYSAALEKANTSAGHMGYLPYAILDGWEQLRRDFAYWRVADYRAVHASTASARSQAAHARSVWQALVLRDIGVWGHFIGDGSQPLHVSVHYNGWGKGPNPNGFTTKYGIHGYFEDHFVNAHATVPAVAALLKPTVIPQTTSLLSQADVMNRIVAYLLTTNSYVPQVYRLDKAGAFRAATPQAIRFADERLAFGAQELRDLTVLAWEDSLNSSVGYPEYTVRSILSGHPVKAPRAD